MLEKRSVLDKSLRLIRTKGQGLILSEQRSRELNAWRWGLEVEVWLIRTPSVTGEPRLLARGDMREES